MWLEPGRGFGQWSRNLNYIPLYFMLALCYKLHKSRAWLPRQTCPDKNCHLTHSAWIFQISSADICGVVRSDVEVAPKCLLGEVSGDLVGFSGEMKAGAQAWTEKTFSRLLSQCLGDTQAPGWSVLAPICRGAKPLLFSCWLVLYPLSMQICMYKHLKLHLNCIARDVEICTRQHSGDVLGMVGNLK